MTPQQIELVQSSWEKVVPIRETASDLFYGRLFELDPSLRPLFKTDIETQGHRLMAILGTAVNGLERLDEIVPVVQSLGRRHAGYGVKDQHYDTVATALLWTLEQGLGPAFTSDVRDAWTQAYVTLATVMKESAKAEA